MLLLQRLCIVVYAWACGFGFAVGVWFWLFCVMLDRCDCGFIIGSGLGVSSLQVCVGVLIWLLQGWNLVLTLYVYRLLGANGLLGTVSWVDFVVIFWA